MLLFLGFCAAVESAALEAYLNRVVPKALHFEKLTKPVRLDVFVTKYGKTITATCTSGKRKISADVLPDNDEYEVTWVEADDKDGWTYSRPTPADETAAMHYMTRLVNSIDPPEFVRATSHRVKTIAGEEHHQMTLVTKLYGRRSMQFIEWKYLKDSPEKHTFVDHQVVVRDGDLI